MGFFDGAGIHGTDEVSSLGTAASHGCVRMAIPDVIDLYDRGPARDADLHRRLAARGTVPAAQVEAPRRRSIRA